MPRSKASAASKAPGANSEEWLKKTEHIRLHLSSILEQSPVPILITDTQGSIEYINPKFTEISGYSFPELSGKNPRIFKSGSTPPEAYEALWETITSDRVWTGEFKNRKKDGTYYWVRASISPIKNSKGEITNFIAVEEDYTSSKNAEEALVEERKKVDELSRAKDVFIQNITHELKTPLSVILSSLSLLRTMPPKLQEHEWERIIGMAERNSVRLRRSIDQILQLGKLDSTEIKKTEVQLGKLMQDIYLEYLPIAEMKGIELDLSIEPLSVSGDQELLRLAISNFVSNAIKFTEKGEVKMGLKGGRGSATITIYDTGIGLSPENQAKLFQKYFKANPNAPGSGIGLALSAAIVNKHGGKINVKTALGRGSTFEVILPRGA